MSCCFKIARENAVAETAFSVDNVESLNLRWFTLEIEKDLCGHATLGGCLCPLYDIKVRPENICI